MNMNRGKTEAMVSQLRDALARGEQAVLLVRNEMEKALICAEHGIDEQTIKLMSERGAKGDSAGAALSYKIALMIEHFAYERLPHEKDRS